MRTKRVLARATPPMGSSTKEDHEECFSPVVSFFFLFLFLCVCLSLYFLFVLCACACLQILLCLDKR